MKKVISILLLVVIMAVAMTGCGGKENAGNEKDALVVGMTSYAFADTHLSNVRNMVLKLAANGSIPMTIEPSDSKADPALEMSNIQTFVARGVDYLLTDYMNINNFEALVKMCSEDDIGLVVYNTDQPSDELMNSYDRFYFVSSAAPDSGRIQGEIVAEYWKEHPEADRNGNGKLDYVMIQGDLGYYDTEMRTKYSIEAVKEAGIEVNEVMTVCANWERAKAQDQMASVIAAHSEDIEAVFANCDDMALGAIEAMKAAGFFSEGGVYVPVVGVDATAVGVEALKDGTMLGTALNDPVELAKIAYQCIVWMEEGKLPITQEMLDEAGFTKATIDENKKIWVSYVRITAENTEDAELKELAD